MGVPKNVDQYIRAAPAEARSVLRQVRHAIREAAPDADESISYGIPFYSYPGEVGIERRLCYFALRGAGIGLFLRPKDLDPHVRQIAKYRSAKSALRFPLDRPIPLRLIAKLVKAADRRHRAATAR
jgi:uncharacterized protein YdhG (YjbR/CyaY superfamily)